MSRRPKLRSRVVVAAFAAVIVVSLVPTTAFASRVGAPAAHRPTRLEVGSDSWKLFKATNDSRGRFNVPKLELNRELSVIARRHSLAMSRSDSLFHTSNVDVYLHG